MIIVIIIIIITKNFNRGSSHDQLSSCCAKRQLSNYRIWNGMLILKVSEGQTGYPEKNPDMMMMMII